MHDDHRGAAAPRFLTSESLRLAITGAAALIGLLCVLAGAGLALYTAWLVFSLIDDPQSVPWIGALVAQNAEYFQAARGTYEGRPFELALAREIYVTGVLLVGVLLLWAIAGLAKALIGAGVSLLGKRT